MTFPSQGLREEERRKTAKHFSVCKKKGTSLFHALDIAEIVKFDIVLTIQVLKIVRRVSENQSFIFLFFYSHIFGQIHLIFHSGNGLLLIKSSE